MHMPIHAHAHAQVLAQRLQPTSALLDALDEEWTTELVGAMRSPGSSPTGECLLTLTLIFTFTLTFTLTLPFALNPLICPKPNVCPITLALTLTLAGEFLLWSFPLFVLYVVLMGTAWAFDQRTRYTTAVPHWAQAGARGLPS